MPPRQDAPLLSDRDAARQLSHHVDDIVRLAQTDDALNVACVKFQMEHAAAMAAFPGHAAEQDAERAHLLAALNRMVDLAATIARAILQRAAAPSRGGSPQGPSGAVPPPPPEERLDSPTSGSADMPTMFSASTADELRSSSVDDLAASDMIAERNATLMRHCCRAAALVFLVSEQLRPAVQEHALEFGLLEVLRSALLLPRSVELRSFAEGFRTEHMNVLSNFTFGCRAVCGALGRDEALLHAVLGATRVDEENPGLVEWAEFTIRNVCALSPEAREHIRAQQPLTKPAYMPGPVGAQATAAA